jgi:sporulation protein YlmC with PRC-barrel domain
MTTAALSSPTASHLFGWLGYRLAVYAGVVAATAVVFIVGAGIYAAFLPAPTIVAPPSVQPKTQWPASVPRSSPAPGGGWIVDDDGIVISGADVPILYSSVVGLPIFDARNEAAGTVTDIIIDRKSGVAEGVVIALKGYWLTRKYVYVPYEEVKWDAANKSAASGSAAPVKGVVKYTRTDMDAFRPQKGDWWPNVLSNPKQ